VFVLGALAMAGAEDEHRGDVPAQPGERRRAGEPEPTGDGQ